MSLKETSIPKVSSLSNIIGFGDCETLLKRLPNESIDLVFTSPPYYNARPEYAEYPSYQEYLNRMEVILHECHRVLNEGRYCIINISPVLIERANRNSSSHRLDIPFDFHAILIKENFEFIDDIIWVKPSGAGCGRGRSFSVNRTPLQYKTIPVTEYILVYRKKTDKLIDWLINKHPNQEIVQKSKILGKYEETNIWKINPASSDKHPAVFPLELAERVIRYYSFINDVVLDPFGGSGTTAKAAYKLDRRFVIFEYKKEYAVSIKKYFKNLELLANKIDIKFIRETRGKIY